MPGIGAQGFVEGAAEIHVDFGQRVRGSQIRSFRALSHRCLGRQFRLGGRLVVERLGKIEIVELEFRIEIIELEFRIEIELVAGFDRKRVVERCVVIMRFGMRLSGLAGGR